MYMTLVTLKLDQGHQNLNLMPGRIAQSVTCLATDVCLTASRGT